MLCKRGFHCTACDDGISFPNKFGRSLLGQLPIEYCEYEWNPYWLKPYKYDSYFVYYGNEYVLEMDGDLGHGNKQFNSKEKDVVGLSRDKLKDALALYSDCLSVDNVLVDCVDVFYPNGSCFY